MLSKFFIYRPNFAIVIAIVITLAGLVSLTAIPVAQYPNVTPPQVTISVNYPGASAQTILNTIAEPIEEQVNGAPGELYMQGSSSSSGRISADRDLRDRHQPVHRPGERAEPRADRRGAAAGGGAVGRHHRARRVQHLRAGGQPVLADE